MIALRLQPDDEKIIREYAELNRISVSELMRQSVMERIENEYDLAAIREYEEAKEKGEVKYYTLDEVKELLK